MNKSYALLLGGAALAITAIAFYVLPTGESTYAESKVPKAAAEKPAAALLAPTSSRYSRVDAPSSASSRLAADRDSVATGIDPVPAVPGGARLPTTAVSPGGGKAVVRNDRRASAPFSMISRAQATSGAATRKAPAPAAVDLPMEFLGQPDLVMQPGAMPAFDLLPGLQLPVSLLPGDPSLALSSRQENALRQVKDAFLGALNANATPASDSPGEAVVGADAWIAAQTWADNRYRLLFGDEAYKRQALIRAKTQTGSQR